MIRISSRLVLLALGLGALVVAWLPLSVAGLWLLAGVVYAAVAARPVEWRYARWIAFGLVFAGLLKVVANAAAPSLGLEASYFASATPTGTAERSTDFRWLNSATQIEGALDLKGEDFAVHFFNDAARFNFGPDAVPGRDQLPFSVHWQGWLLAPSDGARTFGVESAGPSAVRLDDMPLPADGMVNVGAGLHALQVEYSRPEAVVPFLRVTWQRVPGGPLEVIGASDVRWQPNAGSPQLSGAMAMLADVLLSATVIAWLVLGLIRATPTRALLAGVPLVFLAYGMLVEAPIAGRAVIFSGLDDWLVYESSARDILLNGPLMSAGQSHAAPFYGQPLYPYVLAIAHRLSGESIFGPLVLQFAGLGGVVVGTAVLGRRAFGTALDGLVALAALLVLLQLEPEHFKIARQLFNENLYAPLVMASLIVVVQLARSKNPPTWWKTLLTGVLLGLTVISRSQFLLFVPFGLLVLLVAWCREQPLTRRFAPASPRAGRGGERQRAVRGALAMLALIVGGALLVIAPVTARNLVVSGQFVPISSSGGASLLEFHRPPPGLIDQNALQNDALFNALHLDQQTRTVVAFVRADPAGYLATLAPLGAHSIGLQGRNDPGIYWPLFATCLIYLASFGLRRVRALHVWPIHAFVATHLLVLMLFEADTYGYRLVMPMYAPMVAVAAQVPLTAVRAAIRSRDRARALRFAVAGWSAVAALALAWQAKGLVELWPERETALHGLGGAAAHAAMTADRVGASAIYVASGDGTPRRFGAGTLPGLRYPWFKWFDPVRSLPLPASGSSAVYMLSEVNGQRSEGDLTSCLGAVDHAGEVVIEAERARMQCGVLDAAESGVVFDGVARVSSIQVPATGVAGEPLATRIVWQPLVTHPEQYQVSLQLDDPTAGDGIQWGNGTLELYPAREWQPDEPVLSRISVATDGTAVPQTYRLTLGMSPTKPNAPPAMALWQGARTDRVPVGSVTLSPGSSAVGQALPPDMQPIEGPPLIGGGLELIGARPLPAEATIGSPLQVGLLWRAVQDQPAAAKFTMRLVRGSGEVVQEAALTLLGGRVEPSALSQGNVVRDEQKFLISSRAPSEPMSLELATADASVRLGSIKLTGRSHSFDASSGVEATFGSAIELVSHEVVPAQARPGAKVSVKLRWRCAAEIATAYKVFVHVLDPDGQQVVAQRDAEPQDGAAPTTGWVVGEVIEDEYAVTLPSGLAKGSYPIEIGVYDPKSAERLKLANGENRLLLTSGVSVNQ